MTNPDRPKSWYQEGLFAQMNLEFIEASYFETMLAIARGQSDLTWDSIPYEDRLHFMTMVLDAVTEEGSVITLAGITAGENYITIDIQTNQPKEND